MPISAEGDQLHFEDQRAVRPDLGTDLPIPISQVRRNKKTPLAAGRHQLKSFRPAFDHRIEREGSRLPATDRTVEYSTVDQRTMIMAGDLIRCQRLTTRTFRQHFVL